MRFLYSFENSLAMIGGGLCLLAMMVMTVITVFGRYVIGMDLIPGGYNIIEGYLMPLLVFWGLPIAHRQGVFPRLDTLSQHMSLAIRRWISIFVLLAEVAIYAVVLWYASKFVWKAVLIDRQIQVGTDLWPVWPVMFVMPISFGLMMIEMLRLLIADWLSIFGNKPGR